MMKDPIFLGQPSPSLRRMQHMTVPALKDHLDRLQQEHQRVMARLQTRQAVHLSSPKDARLASLERRLAQLIVRAQQIMAQTRQRPPLR